jgi:phage-related baseplate assembly protein
MPQVDPFANLPPISFCNTDTAALQSAVISGFQNSWLEQTGENLQLTLADRRANFLLSLTAYLLQERQLIDQSAKQNLLPFSQDGFIDNLASIFGPLAARLPASPAVCTIEFTLDSLDPASSSLIPAGTLVQSTSTAYIFSTDNDILIQPGFPTGSSTASCTTLGSAGNGLLPGDVATITDWAPIFTATAANVDTTSGGAPAEATEAYRRRLFGITDSYSPAGPKGRYKSYALAANSGISDVSVMGPEDGLAPGNVLVTILMANGEFPSLTVIGNVYAALNDDTVRDLCAYLTVAAPSGVPYSVEVDYWIDNSVVGNSLVIQENVTTAVTGWISDISNGLGGSINPASLTTKVVEAGASYCYVRQPHYRIGLALNATGVLTDDPIINYKGVEQDLQP